MLSLNDFRMVKTGIGKDMSYENTKENLKRIFANRSNSTHSKTESSRDNSSNSSDTGVFYGKSESAENDASLYARRGRDRNNSNRRNTLPKWLLIVTAIKVALETKTQEKVTKGEIVEDTGDHTNALSKKME